MPVDLRVVVGDLASKDCVVLDIDMGDRVSYPVDKFMKYAKAHRLTMIAYMQTTHRRGIVAFIQPDRYDLMLAVMTTFCGPAPDYPWDSLDSGQVCFHLSSMRPAEYAHLLRLHGLPVLSWVSSAPQMARQPLDVCRDGGLVAERCSAFSYLFVDPMTLLGKKNA